MLPWQPRPPSPHDPTPASAVTPGAAVSPDAPSADAEPPVPPDFDTPTTNRVKFARWLYESGRLSDWDTAHESR